LEDRRDGMPDREADYAQALCHLRLPSQLFENLVQVLLAFFEVL